MSKKGGKSLPPWASARWDGKDGRFIQIGNSMFFDENYLKLPYSARCLYSCMMMEAGGQREFTFPRLAAKKYGFQHSTATEGIKALIKLGFIEKTLSGKNLRVANEYRFSYEWKPPALNR